MDKNQLLKRLDMVYLNASGRYWNNIQGYIDSVKDVNALGEIMVSLKSIIQDLKKDIK